MVAFVVMCAFVSKRMGRVGWGEKGWQGEEPQNVRL